jgi:hypothetical protein
MPASRKRTQQYWNVKVWHNQATCTSSFCASRDGALQVSYRAFVNGDGYPEAITSPDHVTVGMSEDDTTEGHHETLPTLWDEWLLHHPEERAEWDIGPRTQRLQALEQQHVPNPRPFTSEHIVAHPAWYRRLYGILGMTDEVFDTFLHVNHFAIADKEAQKLAVEQGSGTPRHKRPVVAIYLEGYSEVPDYAVVPLDLQERACRAYCKRVGYKVHQVFPAATPPPSDVPMRQEIGIEPGQAFVYYRRESNHPYYAVHNLLDGRKIDVIVQFVKTGPSRNLYGVIPADKPTTLHRIELASLWEIQPPTEAERQRYELVERLGKAETDEEGDALTAQLRILLQGMHATEAPTTTPAVTPTIPDQHKDVPAVTPKVCYACRARPARDGSAFCSDTCAHAAAERHVQEMTRGWCSICGTWIGREGCPHST